jgi:hypothetical protein
MKIVLFTVLIYLTAEGIHNRNSINDNGDGKYIFSTARTARVKKIFL